MLDGTTAGRPYFVMDSSGRADYPVLRRHHLTPAALGYSCRCLRCSTPTRRASAIATSSPERAVALRDNKPVPKSSTGVRATGQSLPKTLVPASATSPGSLEYMSPEQAEVNQLDIERQRHLLPGRPAVQLLAGSPPFSRKELENAGMLEMLR